MGLLSTFLKLEEEILKRWGQGVCVKMVGRKREGVKSEGRVAFVRVSHSSPYEFNLHYAYNPPLSFMQMCVCVVAVLSFLSLFVLALACSILIGDLNSKKGTEPQLQQ